MRPSLLALALALAPRVAHAVPAQLTTQGRVLDADGAPVVAPATVTFRLMDAETGGAALWEETQSVTFTSGFYSVMLGADESGNPLDDSVLEQWPLWLEIQFDGEAAMFPRTAVGSVPYARVAGRAEELVGGVVDAASLSVGGAEVVDASGAWVGAPIAVDWTDLRGVPAGFADGSDADALGGVVCADGEYAVYGAVAGWGCADPVALVSPVEADLAALTLTCDALTGAVGTLDGRVAVLESGALVLTARVDALDGRVAALEALTDTDTDTLRDLSCLDGELAKWDSALSAWVCAEDIDTRLTEAEVDAMVADNGYALDADLVGLGADLSAIEVELLVLDASIGSVDADLSLLDARVTSAEASIAAESTARAAVGARVTAVESSVTTLNATTTTQGGLLSTLSTALSALTTRVAVVESGLSTIASAAFSGSFLDLSDVPAGIADGDDDTLGGLVCADGEVATWSTAGGEWTCAADSTVSENQVEAWITDSPLALSAGTTIGGSEPTSIPSGVIAVWSGSVATIPTGWALCDGSGGTPNLGVVTYDVVTGAALAYIMKL